MSKIVRKLGWLRKVRWSAWAGMVVLGLVVCLTGATQAPAATAVLRHLGRRASLLVTTHNLELAGELNGMFRMCHFSEMVEEDRFFFDYRLKPGPCNTRNAIRLLELEGYPQTIVSEARNIARRLEQAGGQGI